MKVRKNNIRELVFIILAIILCLASVLFYNLDKHFAFQWIIFSIWIIGVIIVLLPVIFFFLENRCSLIKNNRELLFVILITLGSAFLRFYKITKIPLLNGDEARDTGFLPEVFLKGEVKDFFGYGVYGIPNMFFALSSIPHLLFGHSILAIRFFAAFFGTLAIILVYLLAKKLFNQRVAVISTILMSCYHVHLQFSRSEFINNFDSFWAPLIIVLLLKSIKEKPYYSLLFGLFLGIASHFYQGIRAVLAFSTAFFLIYNLVYYHKKLNRFLAKIGFFSLGLFLGLGPSIVIIAIRPNEFFNTGTAGGPLFSSLGLLGFLELLPSRLLHSFGALIYYPIEFHYHYGGPFLQFPLNLFSIIGLFFLLRNLAKKESSILLFWIVAVIFCNSALLQGLNHTHRLLSVVPALMIVSGLGIVKLSMIFKKWPAVYRSIMFLAVFLPTFLNLKNYFYDSIWKNAYDTNTKVAAVAGYYTAGFPPNAKFYFLNSPRMSWKSGPSWEYIAPAAQVKDLEEGNLQSVFPVSTREKERLVFIALPEKTEALKMIEEVWTKGYRKDHYYDNELLFITYELK